MEAYYCPGLLNDVSNTELVAYTQTKEPLIVRKALGRGQVYTCMMPWYEAGHTSLSKSTLFLLDTVIDSVQPVKVNGLPVEWLSTRGEQERTVLIANHDSVSWQGTVKIRQLDDSLTECIDLVTGTDVPFRREKTEAKVILNIPAYDVCAVRFL